MNFLRKLDWFTYLELGLIIVTTLYNFNLFNSVKIVGNGASRTLVAVGPQLNIGLPYKDLYEFAPPGYYMMVDGWVRVFGLNMVSFRLLHASLIFIHGVCVLLVCKKIFTSKVLATFIFSFTILIAHSRLVQSDIYSVDLAATTFALLGLASILYIKNKTLKLLSGSTFMIVAFQMKDIYILTLITLLPLYIREFLTNKESVFYKIIIKSMLGVFAVMGSVAIYLQTYKIFPSYITVFKDKMGVSQNYSSLIDYYEKNKVMVTYFDKYFVQNALFVGLIFGILGISCHVIKQIILLIKARPGVGIITIGINTLRRIIEDYSETHYGTLNATFLFIVSLLGGLTLYGQYSIDTRFIPITTCLYILLGIAIALPFEFSSQYIRPNFINTVISVVVLMLVSPKTSIVSQYFKSVEAPPYYNFEVEKYIQSRTSNTDCILHIYGWEVSSTYIYTQRKPCTKYFLINHLTLFGKRRLVKEYQQEIFNNPPKALIINRLGADFNIDNFESQVLKIPDITTNCYTIDPKYQRFKGTFFAPIDIYWPKSNFSNDDLKNCIYKYGKVNYH